MIKGKIWAYALVIVMMACSVAFPFPDEERGTVNIGGGPFDLAVTPDNRFLLVTEQNSNAIAVIDTANFTLIDTVTLTATPYKIAIDPAGDFAYVTQDDGNMAIIDLAALSSFQTGDTISLNYTNIPIGDTGAIPDELTGIDIVADPVNAGEYLIAIGLHDVSAGPDAIVAIYSTFTGQVENTYTGSSGAGIFLSDVKIDTSTGGNQWVYLLTSLTGASLLETFDITTSGPITADTLNPLGDILGEMALDNTGSQVDSAFVVDQSGQQVVELTRSGSDFNETITGFSPLAGIPYGIERVDVSDSAAGGSDTYLYITGGTSSVYVADMSDLTQLVTDGAFTGTIGLASATADPMGIAASSATTGYVYTANAGDNTVSVISDNPWIYNVSVSPAINDGVSPSVLTFYSDESGVSFEIWRGGGVTYGSGTLISNSPEGSVTGGAAHQYSIAASSLLEGNNEIFIFVKDGEGNWGRYAVNVTQDAIPETVIFWLEFGNGRVYVNFTALDVSDISYYTIYYSTNLDDLYNDPPTGSSVVVDLFTPGSDKQVMIDGLTNGVEYYFRIGATDSSGTEGTLSAIKSTIPQATFGLSDIKGEKGNGGCAIMPGEKGSPASMAFPLIMLVAVWFATKLRRGRK